MTGRYGLLWSDDRVVTGLVRQSSVARKSCPTREGYCNSGQIGRTGTSATWLVHDLSEGTGEVWGSTKYTGVLGTRYRKCTVNGVTKLYYKSLERCDNLTLRFPSMRDRGSWYGPRIVHELFSHQLTYPTSVSEGLGGTTVDICLRR